MEGTGLKPLTKRRSRFAEIRVSDNLPKQDHTTEWIDPDTGQFILVDEPYRDPVVEGERLDWAEKYNWHLEASTWPGMYFPHRCGLFVTTDAKQGYDIRSLIQKINGLSEPVSEDPWQGMSAEGHDVFLTPMAKTAQDRRRSKPKETIVRLP